MTKTNVFLITFYFCLEHSFKTLNLLNQYIINNHILYIFIHIYTYLIIFLTNNKHKCEGLLYLFTCTHK